MLIVIRPRARQRAAAHELQIRRREVAVADVKRGALAQSKSNAGERLIGKTGVAVVGEPNRSHIVGNQGINPGQTHASADIRTNLPSTVEIEEAVQHGCPGMRVRRGGEACDVHIIEAVADFALQAKTVREPVTKADVLAPVGVELERRPSGLAFQRAVETIPSVGAAIPTFFSEGRRSDHRDRSQSGGALQNLLHHYPLS
jgi:hypothetical protein